MEDKTIKQIQSVMDNPRVIIGPDDMLNTECRKVTEWHPMIDNLILTMVTIMNTNKALGLAAPQVGVDLQVLVMLDNDRKSMAVVNPVCFYKSEETDYSMEGCLSYPGVQVPMSRSIRWKVFGMIKDGTVEWEFEGLEARIIQHEMDHLVGICHVDALDSLPRSERKRVTGELKKLGKKKR